MTVPSFEDLFAAGRRAITLGPSRFGVEIVDTAGSDVNVIMVASATMAQEIALYAQNEFAAMFFTTAVRRQDDLERFAYDRYGIRPRLAAASVVPLTFSRTNINGFTIPAGTVIGTAEGVLFETLNDLPFAPGQFGPLVVNAVAQVVGTGGNVAANTITQMISAIPDDTTLTVRNLERAAGGTEDQTTEEFAAVVQEFFVSARRGTDTAILAAVLNTPGVVNAFVDELRDGNGDPAGIVKAVISDGSGGGNSVLAARVVTALRSVRGFGVPVLVDAGVPVFVDIEAADLAFKTGFDSTSVLADARVRVLAAVNAIAPNEILRRAAIITALKQTPGLVVPDGALVEPVGDLVPNTGEVIRTTPNRIVLNGT